MDTVADIVGNTLSNVCGTDAPTTSITTADSRAYVYFVSTVARNDMRFQLNFTSSVEGVFLPSLFLSLSTVDNNTAQLGYAMLPETEGHIS